MWRRLGSSGGGGASGPTGDVLSAAADGRGRSDPHDDDPAGRDTGGRAGACPRGQRDAGSVERRCAAERQHRDRDVEDDGKSDADVRVLEGSNAVFELRSVSDTLYLQANVRSIFTLLHKPKVFANLRAQTKSMPGFVQAVLNGKWVSLPAAALSSLAQAGGSGTGGSSAQGIKLLNDLRDVIKRDVTVTAAGRDSRGQHYTLSGDEAVLSVDLQAAIADAVPGGAALGSRIPASKASHRTIHVDAWVNGGALSALSLDLAQFGDPGTVPAGTTLPLVIGFERSGATIDVPSGAVPVDLTQLGTLVGALSGGSGG